jgi:hypothetical protein
LIETAREKSLKVGNEKYSGVNQAMHGVESDPEFIGSALGDAETALRGSTQDTTLLKNMTKEYLGDSKNPGRTPTYEDLQGEYSRLGNEISKGTLPGDVFKAYDKLHEAIGEEMQRLAEEKGQGAALKAARDYWWRMKQTFGKPLLAKDSATGALRKVASKISAEDELQNRIRLLGSFDPDIPRRFADVQNIQKGMKSLPKPVPARELTQSLSEAKAKVPAPKPPKGKPIIPEPEPVPPWAGIPPERVPIPDRPQPTSPKLPKQFERVPIPDRPNPVNPDASVSAKKAYAEPNATKPTERPDVNTRQIREQLLEKWQKNAEGLGNWKIRALVSGPLGAAIGYIFGPQGAEIGYATGSIVGPEIINKIIDRPVVREWLTRPPQAELDALRQLPNADRIRLTDGLGKVVEEAKRQGIKVDSRILSIVGATGAIVGPRTKQLQELRDKR